MIRKLINIICLYSMNLLKPHQYGKACVNQTARKESI